MQKDLNARKEAEDLAKGWIRVICNAYGYKEDWIQFGGFSRTKTFSGTCDGKTRYNNVFDCERYAIIKLSGWFIDLGRPIEKTENTIIHELAHAIDWIRNGKMDHSDRWKDIMKNELGLEPNRCMELQPNLRRKWIDLAPYIWICSNDECSNKTGFYRKPKYMNRICNYCKESSKVKPQKNNG